MNIFDYIKTVPQRSPEYVDAASMINEVLESLKEEEAKGLLRELFDHYHGNDSGQMYRAIRSKGEAEKVIKEWILSLKGGQKFRRFQIINETQIAKSTVARTMQEIEREDWSYMRIVSGGGKKVKVYQRVYKTPENA